MLISHVRETLKAHQRVEAHIESLKGLTRGEVPSRDQERTMS